MVLPKQQWQHGAPGPPGMSVLLKTMARYVLEQGRMEGATEKTLV